MLGGVKMKYVLLGKSDSMIAGEGWFLLYGFSAQKQYADNGFNSFCVPFGSLAK